MKFILSPDFQSMIPLTNWSYPVKLDPDNWPPEFLDLPHPRKALFLNEVEASRLIPIALDEWLTAMLK